MVASLHAEPIGPVTAERWLLLTHGVFGSGGNLRTVARRLVEKRPQWGVVLVDLRLHGRSGAGEPPHTVAACAQDLLALVDASTDRSFAAIAGHSFGGKVVLVAQAALGARIAQAWVLDTSPTAAPAAWDDPDGGVRKVWDALRAVPRTWARRDQFVAALAAKGLETSTAQWLATNLVPDGEQLALRLDLDAIGSLVADYYALDAWPLVEGAAKGRIHLVKGEHSTVLSAAELDRATAAGATTHVIPRAGHWLHADNPQALIDLLAQQLP